MIQPGVDFSRAPDVLALWAPAIQPGDVLQLTVEQGFSSAVPEAWTQALDAASARGDVVAHAVYGAPFSTPRHPLAHDWLKRTAQVLERWPARWLTDHVGCCRAAGVQGAPLPLPTSPALVQLAIDHFDWVAQALQLPLGLENLALAVSVDDVLLQPELVDRILEAIDGVLLLDLHNLWCQAVNFHLDPIDLLERWPLERVVQLHIAGGRADADFRRDTHDRAVPDEVFTLIPEAMARCPRLEVAVLERIGGSADPAMVGELDRLRGILEEPVPATRFRPRPTTIPLRDEAPDIQHALFEAVRENRRDQVEDIAPGWWQDERAWRVATELMARWSREI